MKTTTIILLILGVILTIVFFILEKEKANSFETLSNENINIQYLLKDDSVISKTTMKSLFKNFNLINHWPNFEPIIKDDIRILTKLTSEDNIKVGQSKIGGLPDLPDSINWFRENNGKPLSFIAQINCSEIKGLNQNVKLPNKGIIYFFYSSEQDAWGFDYKDKDKFKVYYSDKTDNLRRNNPPSDLPKYSIFNPCKLTFKNSVSLPSWENDFVTKNLNSEEIDNYIEITSNDQINKMFGYADNIQGEMELECQLVTHGLYCGDPSGYNDPRRPELEKGENEWNLLLQIDSEDEKTGMMWGDSGKLYFWIKEQDLKDLNFDNSWFILQSY